MTLFVAAVRPDNTFQHCVQGSWKGTGFRFRSGHLFTQTSHFRFQCKRREWEERIREWIKTDQFEPVILTPWIPAAVFLLPPPLDPKFAFKTSSFSRPQQVCWLLSVNFSSCGIWGKPGGGFQGISLKSWAKFPPNRTMFLMYSFRRGAEMLTLKWWLF